MLRDHEGSIHITQQGKLEMNSMAQKAELPNRTTGCYVMIPTPEKRINRYNQTHPMVLTEFPNTHCPLAVLSDASLIAFPTRVTFCENEEAERSTS